MTGILQGFYQNFRSFQAPTPEAATAGWYGGGRTPSVVSTVQRITFATDTATASVRGPLSLITSQFAATSDLTYGWFGGGYTQPGQTSTIQRITFATDTATASARGPFSLSKYDYAKIEAANLRDANIKKLKYENEKLF